MNKLKLLAVVPLAFFAAQADALLVDENLLLDEFSAELIGTVVPGVPASEAEQVIYINTLLDVAAKTTEVIDGETYTRTDYDVTALADAILDGAVKEEVDEEDPTATVEIVATDIDVTDYDYLVAKYGTNTLVWYVGDITGTVDITQYFDSYALSNIGLFTVASVPEPGTLGLLGLGLVGIGLIRRRRSA